MDLASMVIKFASTFSESLWNFLWVLGAFLGVAYIGYSLLKMMRASRLPGTGQPPVTTGDIVIIMIIGALLVNLPQFINAVWNSFGSGQTSYGPVAYASSDDFGKFAPAIDAVLTLAAVAGGCFFLRGIIILKRATIDGHTTHGADDTTFRACTHMIGGAALVQIADVIEAFRQSFGLYW